MVLCTDAAEFAAELVVDLYPVVAGALSVELPTVAADAKMYDVESADEEKEGQGTLITSPWLCTKVGTANCHTRCNGVDLYLKPRIEYARKHQY